MQYTYTLATGAEEPITLGEAKEYLKVDFTTDDTMIEELISSAREIAEEFCNRTFIDKTITFQTTEFESSFLLPYPNHHEITSVKVDGSDATYTKTGLTHFELSVAGWSEASECVVIYEATASVGTKIKHAIKMLVRELYDNRGATTISENAYAYMLPLKVYQ